MHRRRGGRSQKKLATATSKPIAGAEKGLATAKGIIEIVPAECRTQIGGKNYHGLDRGAFEKNMINQVKRTERSGTVVIRFSFTPDQLKDNGFVLRGSLKNLVHPDSREVFESLLAENGATGNIMRINVVGKSNDCPYLSFQVGTSQTPKVALFYRHATQSLPESVSRELSKKKSGDEETELFSCFVPTTRTNDEDPINDLYREACKTDTTLKFAGWQHEPMLQGDNQVWGAAIAMYGKVTKSQLERTATAMFGGDTRILVDSSSLLGHTIKSRARSAVFTFNTETFDKFPKEDDTFMLVPPNIYQLAIATIRKQVERVKNASEVRLDDLQFMIQCDELRHWCYDERAATFTDPNDVKEWVSATQQINVELQLNLAIVYTEVTEQSTAMHISNKHVWTFDIWPRKFVNNAGAKHPDAEPLPDTAHYRIRELAKRQAEQAHEEEAPPPEGDLELGEASTSYAACSTEMPLLADD